MFPSFLTPRIDRLEPDGAIQAVTLPTPLGRLLPPLLLLSRAHCTFQRLDLAGLSRREARQAANFHALGAAPYAAASHMVIPGASAAGVWFWSAERVSVAATSIAARRPLAVPETLAQPPGEGWRIVKLSGGYEAQAWAGGELVASSWRRDRFDAAAWLNFTRAAGLQDAPERPPEARPLPLVLSARLFLSGEALDLRRAAGLTAGAAAAATVLAAVFLAAQALRLETKTAQLDAETRALTPTATDPAAAEARRALQADIQRFLPAAERTNPLSAAEVVVGIAALQEVTPSRLTVEEDEVELVLPYEALARTPELTAEFTGSGYFEEVRPRPNAEARELVFTMRLKPGLPPLSEGG